MTPSGRDASRGGTGRSAPPPEHRTVGDFASQPGSPQERSQSRYLPPGRGGVERQPLAEHPEPFFGTPVDDAVPSGTNRRKRGLLKLLAAVGVLACLFLAYTVSINQRDSGTDTAGDGSDGAPTEPTAETDGADPEDVSAAEPETETSEEPEQADDTGQSATTETTAEAAVTTPEQQVVDSPPVRGLLAGDAVVIEGEVPSQDVADSLIELMQPLAGSGGVVSELVVNPAAPPVDGVSIAVADEVVFPPGSDEISPQFFPTLDQMVAVMQLSPNITVVVEGHTDSDGNEVLNLALSQRRAEAVVDYIAANSINRFRLEPRGRGSGEPIDDNSTEDGRRRNRRIEFEVNGFGINLDE